MKLNPRIINQVESLVKAGLSDNGIANHLGVNLTTFKNWIELGGEGYDPVISSDLHRDLYSVYSSAKSELEESLIHGIKGSMDWRAKAWLLERLFRDDYNPKITDLVEQEIKKVVEKLSSVMSENAFDEFINGLTLAQNSYLPETEDQSLSNGD